MSRVERDPERGRAAAARLKALVVKGILIKAAEQGYITQLACKMPECFCPEELGGACYFEPVTDELSDWMPTHEHFPRSKREGGHRSGKPARKRPAATTNDRRSHADCWRKRILRVVGLATVAPRTRVILV